MLKGIALALSLSSAFLVTALGQPRPAPPPVQQTSPIGQPQQRPQPPTKRPTPASSVEVDEDEVVRITTNLVQVDAVVTDKDGRQVTNLTAEDFEITENGQSRQITNFSYVRTGQPVEAAPQSAAAPARPRNAPPVPPALMRPGQVQRTIALVVDDLMLSAEGIHFTRRALRKYVDEQVQSGDMVAIVRTSAGVSTLQQFTNDKRILYRAIEGVRWSPRRGGKVMATESTLGAANPVALPGGVDVERSGLADFDQLRDDRFVIGTLGALDFVVRGLREMPGRKAVILFSDGLLLRDSRGETARYMENLNRLIDRANRASVVFYTIDARGLQVTGIGAADDVAGSPAAPGDSGPGGTLSGATRISLSQVLSGRSAGIFEGQAGLRYLSDATGGTALANQSNLNLGIRRALDDMSGYYLIGYRPDDSAFDPATGRIRFNTWEIKVKGRPDLKVRTRNGYVGEAGDAARARPTTRAGQLMSALVSPFAAAGVNLRLTSLFIDTPTGGPALRSLLLIDPRTLTFTRQPDGQQQTVMDILAVTFGEDGRIVDQLNRIETIRVKPDAFQRFLGEGMVYDLNVPVKRPGAYQLRIAVRDAATERVGSVSQYVEVPDLKRKRLTLSGLVVASAPAAAAATATAADPETEPAARRFRRGAMLDYGFVVYNARPDRATSRPRLTIQTRLFRDGQEVYAGQPQPLDTGAQTDMTRIEAAGRLQLGADLRPGEYVLQVVVTDPLADESHRVATQWIDFEIAQ